MHTWTAKWIRPVVDTGDVAPIFLKEFSLTKDVKKASLTITAMGVYEASLNGSRVGDYIFAPGWTDYYKRLQYQTYDITELLKEENYLTVTIGKGWYRSRLAGWTTSHFQDQLRKLPAGLFLEATVEYEDGTRETIATDESWKVSESSVRFSEIYDGEIYDASFQPDFAQQVICFDGPPARLIPQQGEVIREQEHLHAARIFTTPKGETVVDFGQEITGYVMASMDAKKGDTLDLSFAEVMDRDGNFYTENYRSAKAQYHYICCDGKQTYKPKLTFWGFRYIRVNTFPGGTDQITPETFTAIAVYSGIERTGFLSCSNIKLNQLFSNIIWGQKGNFLDVPTDCPQRDERLGWTGDAQVFIRTACLNYDVEKFFTKWLTDMAIDQHEDGYIGDVVPDLLDDQGASAAWADAVTICPWTLYQAYGNPEILQLMFPCMKKWVDYVGEHTTTPYLWTGCFQRYGDWLGLDSPPGSYEGATDRDFVASAYYAYSTSLVIKTGRALGEDVSKYEALYQQIVSAFRSKYSVYHTQTECVLAAHFHLATDPQATADQLAKMVQDCGTHLETGFVGTPYLLHVLSDYGHADLAYSLLLREDRPSWLYSVGKGATTIWEHWDGIMENGDFWSSNMNSFNHYSYGSVGDWVYSVAAGINTVEDHPGYEKVRIAPVPDSRLNWLKATLKTRHGLISSQWKKEATYWRYEITTPVAAEIVIDGTIHQVTPGTYFFYSARC